MLDSYANIVWDLTILQAFLTMFCLSRILSKPPLALRNPRSLVFEHQPGDLNVILRRTWYSTEPVRGSIPVEHPLTLLSIADRCRWRISTPCSENNFSVSCTDNQEPLSNAGSAIAAQLALLNAFFKSSVINAQYLIPRLFKLPLLFPLPTDMLRC